MSAQGSVGFRWGTITGPYHANFSQVETQKLDPHWFYCLQWGCNNLFCQECSLARLHCSLAGTAFNRVQFKQEATNCHLLAEPNANKLYKYNETMPDVFNTSSDTFDALFRERVIIDHGMSPAKVQSRYVNQY